MITVIILKKQKIENMAGNIPGRSCEGENFSGVFHQGGNLISGDFTGRTFLDNISNQCISNHKAKFITLFILPRRTLQNI